MYETPRVSPTGGRFRRLFAGRPLLIAAVVLVVLFGLGSVGAAGMALTRDDDVAGEWRTEPVGTPTPTTVGESSAIPSASASETAGRAVSLSATGDIIMGNAPNRLPANGGDGFFDDVKDALAADLVMGNLEQPITDNTGVSKCAKGSTKCHQFRVPPSYAAHLKDAGFELLNQANNHGNDYGPAGYTNTQQALKAQGLAHTGAPDEITVQDVEGVKVAVVGFSSYSWSNSLIDIDSAKEIVEEAADKADLVVVQVHMGAEGADKIHVRPGTEMFLGENRGDPVKFSHAVIDAGADLVVGHGPHVLRAMEFYEGRLIAYSLGNFAGGGNMLSGNGRLGLSGVLKVSLEADGTFSSGEFISTRFNGAGLPRMDANRGGLKLVAELSAADFKSTGARFDDAGAISQR